MFQLQAGHKCQSGLEGGAKISFIMQPGHFLFTASACIWFITWGIRYRHEESSLQTVKGIIQAKILEIVRKSQNSMGRAAMYHCTSLSLFAICYSRLFRRSCNLFQFAIFLRFLERTTDHHMNWLSSPIGCRSSKVADHLHKVLQTWSRPDRAWLIGPSL